MERFGRKNVFEVTDKGKKYIEMLRFCSVIEDDFFIPMGDIK